jgi:hypothetical protein
MRTLFRVPGKPLRAAFAPSVVLVIDHIFAHLISTTRKPCSLLSTMVVTDLMEFIISPAIVFIAPMDNFDEVARH